MLDTFPLQQKVGTNRNSRLLATADFCRKALF